MAQSEQMLIDILAALPEDVQMAIAEGRLELSIGFEAVGVADGDYDDVRPYLKIKPVVIP